MRRFLYIFSLLLFAIPSRAQLNDLFTDELYVDEVNFPGKWFIYDSVSSQGMLDTIMGEFNFKAEDLFFCKTNKPVTSEIVADTIVNPTFNLYERNGMPSYGTKDPIVKLDFEVNGKRSTAYSIKQTSSHASDVAFFLIPGSGVNQSTQLQRGVGYQNLNCQIRELLGKYGDTYIHCKPNEDFRAIRRNGAKLGDYMYEELILNNKDYALSYLIECIAFVQKLKEQYKQVVVVGLSQGAWATVIVSQITHPDAAVVSAGYSVLYDSYYPATLRDISFENLLVEFSKDSIREQISKGKTQYFFTYGRNDNGWSYGRLEELDHNTEAFYAGISNASFFFDYDYHAYPCAAVEDFVKSAIRFPEASVELLRTQSREEAFLKINLKGRFPLSFDLFRDDTFFRHFDVEIQDNLVATISEYGTYDIRNLVDSIFLLGFKSNAVAYNFDSTYTPRLSNATSSVILEGDSLVLSTEPVYGVTYRWMRNGVLCSETATNKFAAKQTGEYSVKLSYKDWKSLPSDTFHLTVFSPVVKTSPAGVDHLLPGDTVGLYADSFPSFTYSWYKDGMKVADSTSMFVAREEGAYYVKVSAPNHTATVSYALHIGRALPALNHSGDTLLFEGDDIQLSLKSYPHAAYQWYKNGVITSIADSGNFYMVKDNGLYYATVVSSNGTLFTTDSFQVFFVQNTMNITSDTTIYSEDTVLFSVDVPASATCEWYRNGVVIPGETGTSLFASKPGQYYARITLNKYYARPTNKVSVHVVYPALNVRGTFFIMPGDSLQLFTSEFEGLTYQWFNGADAIAAETNRSIWVKDGGTYHVQVTKNERQQHSDTVSINVNKVYTPELTIHNDTYLLNGESMDLSVSALVNANYQWYKNGTLFATTTINSLLVSQPGSYHVIVKPVFQNKIKYVSQNVLFKQYQPRLSITGDSSFWPGIDVNVYVNEKAGYTYEWYRNGSPAGVQATTYTASGEGVYFVRVTARSGYYVNSDALNLVKYEPLATASGNTTFYTGDSVELNVPYEPHYTYKWYRDGNILPSASAHTIKTGQEGDYTAEIFNGNGKVTTYNAVSVSVIYPRLNQAGTVTLLNGDSTIFSVASLPGIGFQWYRNNTPIEGAVSSTLTVKKEGVYHVEATALSGVISSSNNVAVDIAYQDLQINRAGNITLLEGDSFRLVLNAVPNASYQWYRDQVPVANATSATLMVSASGRYHAEACFNDCTIKKVSSTVLVNVYKPVLNFTQDTLINQGQQVYLETGNMEGMRYVWYRNDTVIATTGSGITVNKEGAYYVRIITTSLYAAKSNTIRVGFNTATGITAKVTTLPGISARLSSGMLNVTVENEEQGAFVFQLIDMSGRVVMDGKMNKMEDKIVFGQPVPQLMQGMFILRVMHRSGVYVQKLLNN